MLIKGLTMIPKTQLICPSIAQPATGTISLAMGEVNLNQVLDGSRQAQAYGLISVENMWMKKEVLIFKYMSEFK